MLTLAVFVADNPVAGVHVYELAPEAVKFTLSPIQIVPEGGTTEITGIGKTVKLTELDGPGQPAIEPVTV